jgi:hypothetical protein
MERFRCDEFLNPETQFTFLAGFGMEDRKPDLLIFFFRFTQHIHHSMNDGKNVYLIGFDSVDDPKGTFDYFTDMVKIIFGDFTTGMREFSDLN